MPRGPLDLTITIDNICKIIFQLNPSPRRRPGVLPSSGPRKSARRSSSTGSLAPWRPSQLRWPSNSRSGPNGTSNGLATTWTSSSTILETMRKLEKGMTKSRTPRSRRALRIFGKSYIFNIIYRSKVKAMYLMLHGQRNQPLPQPNPPQSPPRNGLGWVDEEIEELQGQVDA